MKKIKKTTLEDYSKQFPTLITDILEFFDVKHVTDKDGTLHPRCIAEFCVDKNKKTIYQPHLIDRICQKLCQQGDMGCVKHSDGTGALNTYYVTSHFDFQAQDDLTKKNLNFFYNTLIYGFNYLFDIYKQYVIPVVAKNEDETLSCGTAFLFYEGIVTAKHCITDVKNLSIKGFSKEELNNAKIYISDNPGLDLAYIDINRQISPFLLSFEGKVLDEVLVMGYPKIPTFSNFITGEKATISSMAARLTPTTGNIAASGDQYLNKIEAMLITAKIRGGNSGGPVINNHGELVGVACQLPDYKNSQGDYDELGYGIAIPTKYLLEIIDNKPKTLDIGKDFFYDFV